MPKGVQVCYRAGAGTKKEQGEKVTTTSESVIIEFFYVKFKDFTSVDIFSGRSSGEPVAENNVKS